MRTRLPASVAVFVFAASLAASARVSHAQIRCWAGQRLDEVATALGPAVAQERLSRAKKALAENALAAHWHYQAYLAHRALGNTVAAESELQEALANGPSSPAYFGALAEHRLRQGRWHSATLAAREQVRLDPKNPVGHCLLGSLLETGDDVRGASEEFQACLKAIRKSPRQSCSGRTESGLNLTVRWGGGDSYYFSPNRWESGVMRAEALSLILLAPVFQKPCPIAIEVQSPSSGLILADDRFYIRGLKSFAESQIRKLKRSPGVRSKLKQRSSESSETEASHGLRCPNRNEVERVLQTAKRNLAMKGNPIWAYWNAQAAWGSFALGDKSSALDYVAAGLRADASNVLLYLIGGRVAAEVDASRARTFLEAALALEPENPWVHFRLAEWFQRNNKTASAMQHYQLCIDYLGYPPDYAYHLDSGLKKIEGNIALGEEAAKRLKALHTNSNQANGSHKDG